MPNYINYKSFCVSLMLIRMLVFNAELEAQLTTNDYGFTFKNDYYYLTDTVGEILESIESFTYAEPFSGGLALVEQNLKFGFIDTTGNLVLDYQFIDAGSFFNGLAYASLGEKYGYINTKGEFVIEPQFDRVCDFIGEYARVLTRNPNPEKYGPTRWIEGLIDKQGNLISDKYFSYLTFKDEGVVESVLNDSIFTLSIPNDFVFKELKIESNDEVISVLPTFDGGEHALARYFNIQTRYPLSAFRNRIQGKCYIKFVVDEKGNISDVFPAKIGAPILLKEGMRVVKLMPQWIPGESNGNTIRVSYTIPINIGIN